MTTPPVRGFSTEEFENRLANIQMAMAGDGIGVLLLTTEHDIYYFTGFLSQFWQSPTRPWFVVIPSEGKPIAVIPEIGVQSMKSEFMTDIRSWSSPHETDDGVSLLNQALTECLKASGSNVLGLNKGRETHIRMPLGDFETVMWNLKSSDPNIAIKDATSIIRDIRMIKSEAEINKVRYVASTVSGVFENLFDFADIGMTDAELFKNFKLECLKAGVDNVSYLVGGAGQQGYDDVIAPPAGRKLRSGDILMFDTGCTFDGYYCDFDRNYGFGAINDTAKRIHNAVWQATEAGLAMAKPGNSCAQVFRAMDEVLKKNGALGESVGRYGHGLGIQLTEPPSFTAWEQDILREGMIMTLEPGMIYAPGRMILHEENLVIRKNGPELLSRRAPAELPVKL